MTGRADQSPRPTAVPTLDALLSAQAGARPDRVFLRFRDGDLTFAETEARVDAAAAGLAEAGVAPGQLVPVVLPNGVDLVVTWLALCRLGAVATLVNTALRGPALVHALDLTTAGVLVTDESRLPSLAAVAGERLGEPRRPGSCGRVIPQYDIAVVDDDDLEVSSGEVGELVVRPNEPALLADGYYGQPEATLASRRNLWFHTGDLVRRDAEGYVYFVGRTSDSIRRRGENISAFEVEEVVKLHPQVLDAAAYGVPSELSEDDVMVAVVARPGAVLVPDELIAFCRDRMARHMLPRYVDVVAELPRTPTEKVEKAALRSRGVTATAWDREAARAAT